MRGIPTRRHEEEIVNDEIRPPGPQYGQVPQGDQVLVVPPDMTNKKIEMTFLTLTKAITTQVNTDVGPGMNFIDNTMALILRYFGRMSPLIFLRSRVSPRVLGRNL